MDHEAPGRSTPFTRWYAQFTAPTKEVEVLDRWGHRPLFEQPGNFVEIMTTHVKPVTR